MYFEQTKQNICLVYLMFHKVDIHVFIRHSIALTWSCWICAHIHHDLLMFFDRCWIRGAYETESHSLLEWDCNSSSYSSSTPRTDWYIYLKHVHSDPHPNIPMNKLEKKNYMLQYVAVLYYDMTCNFLLGHF